MAAPEAQIGLVFSSEEVGGHPEPVHLDLSAVARCEDTVFLGCDETAGIERLTRLPGTPEVWGRHLHIDLADVFDLPEPGGEIDVEGLAVEDGWLWVVGSQALKRPHPCETLGPAEALDAFGALDFDPNRQLLGRLPLVETPDGLLPVKADGARRAGCLKLTRRGKLRKWLRHDPLIGPALALPGKENGFDVEGIAVKGRRVWLGLRGPVLRGHAVVLELELAETRPGRLTARRIDGDRRYRLHLLATRGEGIRDLARDGDDLLLLVGTTMAGDGPSAILRWADATHRTMRGLWPAEALSVACSLPYRGRTDNPEGLGRWTDDRWLVVHDSPDPARLGPAPRGLRADLWRLS